MWLAVLLASPGPVVGGAPTPGVAVDSLRHLLALPQTDFNRVTLLCQISDQLWTQHTDSAAVYANKALALARRIHYQQG